MSKSPIDTRRAAEAFVHRSVVEMLVRQARAVDEFTHPEAFAAAIAACSPTERKALARLGRALRASAKAASAITSPAS